VIQGMHARSAAATHPPAQFKSQANVTGEKERERVARPFGFSWARMQQEVSAISVPIHMYVLYINLARGGNIFWRRLHANRWVARP